MAVLVRPRVVCPNHLLQGVKEGERGERVGRGERVEEREEWKSGRETEERETTWVEDMVSWYESKQPQHTTPQHTTPQHNNTTPQPSHC